MTAYSIFSTLAAIALIFLLIHSIWNTAPEKRRAFVIPGLIQLFCGKPSPYTRKNSPLLYSARNRHDPLLLLCVVSDFYFGDFHCRGRKASP